MTQITNKIHVTNIDTVREGPTEKFDHVITVCQDPVEDNISNNCTYYHINLADGKTNKFEGGTCSYGLFEEAATTLEEALKKDETVLIHCHTGISRSPSVTAAVLANKRNISVNKAINEIQSHRPIVNPVETLREYAKRYANQGKNNEQ